MFEMLWNQLKICNTVEELHFVYNNIQDNLNELTIEQYTKLLDFYIGLLKAYKEF